MVLLLSTPCGGLELTSTCWPSRSLMVGGFFASAMTCAEVKLRVPTAAPQTASIAANEGFMDAPSASPAWLCHRWLRARSGLVSDKPRYAASALRVRVWRAFAGSDFAVRTTQPGAAAIDPCAPARR